MSSPDGDALPAWFSSGLYTVLVWWSVAGISALILLAMHSYHPVTCTVIATVTAAAAWHFRPRRHPDASQAHLPALAALAIALALLGVAGVSHSEHVLTDRDPGIYINTGRSIARTHALRPVVPPGPFDDTRTFSLSSSGFTILNHRLEPNFLTFLPALLALGWSAGGDTGMLVLPAVLGALALLALYALGSKLIGPRWALLGPALLVLAPLQSWFARDAYTELPLQLFALGGIWLFLESREGGGPIEGAIAGVITGTVMFVRIDALAVLVAIPSALVIEYLRAARLDPEPRSRRRGALLGFAAAVAVTTVGGARISQRLSPYYLRDLASELHQLELAFAAGLLVALAIIVIHRVRPGIGHRIARSNTLLILASGFTIAVAFYAFRWRPRGGTPPSFLTRTARNAFYQSSSFRWFAWYLGVLTVVLMVMGFIVLGVRAVRTDSPAFFLLAATMPMTLLYVARPSIAPDHLWAMRRYLPVVLPAITIAAAAAALWITSAVDALWPRLRAVVVVLLLAGMLVPAALAGKPLVGAKMQGGALDAIHTVCRRTGPNAAIAVEPFQFLGAILPQPLRGFCGVPVANTKPEEKISLRDVAAHWKATGRQLYVITAGPQHLLGLAPDATLIAHLTIPDSQEPDRTLSHRPDRYKPRPVEMWLYRISSG
jgi:hypothetical protein